MSPPIISPAVYVSVLVALVLLTLLTVGLSFLDMEGTWHTVFGVSIACVKASLVGIFFMHLVHSKSATWGVVLVAIFWLSIVLGALMFSDYTTRSWFPFTPGH